FLCVAFVPALQARSGAAVDGVTVKGGKAYYIRGEELKPITNELTLPFDVEMNTNGIFKIGDDGKERKLQEGQVIRSDGWLTSPDGAVQPVYDHIAVKAGRVVVVRDGQGNALAESMTCTNGLNLAPDGWCVYPGGRRARLLDGQLFQLDGSTIPAEDAATLVNGQVVVQKDGGLIHLVPVQMMGMDDGTKVYGNGTIQKHDGTTMKLKEGQTVLMEGIRVGNTEGMRTGY
ncbi:MAG TPA: DUF6799 domain-containing protein, partial [Candidatus Binatia bacterium]|nr:DUF6799 domain-containing protein [Candidatus Binatia bacterium]